MTATAIKNKIENLDFWLTHNPSHADFKTKETEKKNLEYQLLQNN
jgi:hypothetical protein